MSGVAALLKKEISHRFTAAPFFSSSLCAAENTVWAPVVSGNCEYTVRTLSQIGFQSPPLFLGALDLFQSCLTVPDCDMGLVGELVSDLCSPCETFSSEQGADFGLEG